MDSCKRTLRLLEGSFLPDVATEKLLTYSRHRQTLIQNAGDYINKMQKAIRLTNIRLDDVITDVTGKSVPLIIEAILGGERNHQVLASLADARIRKSQQEIAEAFAGDWREEYLFELKQSYELYRYLHAKVQECDQQMHGLLEERVAEKENKKANKGLSALEEKRRPIKMSPLDVQTLFCPLSGGIDLASIEGVGLNTLLR